MYKKHRLTSCVFQPADGIGKKSYAAQEARPLSFMDLFVVPYADGDGVCLSNVAENKNKKWGSQVSPLSVVWCQSELYICSNLECLLKNDNPSIHFKTEHLAHFVENTKICIAYCPSARKYWHMNPGPAPA